MMKSLKYLIIALIICNISTIALAEESETDNNLTVDSQENPLYQEESDNDSQGGNQQWQVFKGNCPLETRGSLSYKEAQERRIQKR